MIYLDNAATTFPKPDCVYDKVNIVQRTIAVNVGRGSYRAASEAMRIVDETRQLLASLVGAAGPDAVVFTPSATIAANEIILGLEWDSFKNVYVTPFEHNAIARPLFCKCKEFGIELQMIPFDPDTHMLDEDELERLFAVNPPDYVFVNHVSNVTGTIVPIEKIAALSKAYDALVVVDGSQSVGLLPIAVAGIDIDKMMQGAADARALYTTAPFAENDCFKYAALRNLLYRNGKNVEILVGYEPFQQMLNEWWKQLYGESEGKDNKGIFPASVIFSTDLHSLGQYIQEGERFLFETVLDFKETGAAVEIPFDAENVDGLNFLAGKKLNFVNSTAMLGTLFAHNDGGVPNIVLEVSDRTEYSFGYLVYFFELACAVSGYMLGVNPFNQPGVEAYKKNMFALLGKSGYEKEREALEARMK